jgi:hypothetical protein
MMEPIQATKPRQGEQEQEQKEEPEDMKGHRILAAGNDEHVELLKGRVSKAEGIVKPFRREGRIIHYRVGQWQYQHEGVSQIFAKGVDSQRGKG